jgi:hypothetical protein
MYSTSKPILRYSTWYLFDVSAIFAIACAAALGFLGQRGIARLPARWANPHPTVAAMLIALIWTGAVVTEIRWFSNMPILRWDKSGCANHDGPCAVVPDSHFGRTVSSAVLWFRSTVPLAEGERVGAFNAGFAAMLLLPTGLVNLDGLANEDIKGEYLGRVGLWPSPTLAEYISRERIRYVIDHIPPWTDWDRVVGLKTELLMKTEARAPDSTEENPLPYYVVRFVQAIPSPPGAGGRTSQLFVPKRLNGVETSDSRSWVEP